MAAFTAEEVRRLAGLARIGLSESDAEHLAGELDVIVDAVAQVATVATDDVVPTSHPVPLADRERADVVTPGLTAEAALSGAPQVAEGRFRVPQILDED